VRRFEWTADGYQRVLDQGLRPAEVHEALTSGRRKLLQHIDDDTVGVLVHIAGGVLIEVWLVEDPSDGSYEVFAAFEAGAVGKARWMHVIGEEER
jgi:hypothetical protein